MSERVPAGGGSGFFANRSDPSACRDAPGLIRPWRPEAYAKCGCGCTLLTRTDYQLHICWPGQKPTERCVL